MLLKSGKYLYMTTSMYFIKFSGIHGCLWLQAPNFQRSTRS
uniref:Uncharacterized protein n=1 Tax=Anguilla anguilla TaxID=7936 RepID=A0A0E9TXQ8_ANGAN